MPGGVHVERHRTERIGWLRAAVLGANDGIVSTASLIVGVAAAKEYFGSSGLYAVAILSGLADMDAITLSITQLVHGGTLAANTGWRLILVAG